ncbi:MAG: amidohydrolase family protein [Thermoplasmata archaeon]|nr:amidohydrolase family protein [Thermoplasmata archaeon]
MPERSKNRSDRGVHPNPGAGSAAAAPFDVHLHLSQYWPDLASHSYGGGVNYSLVGLLHEMDLAGVQGGLLIPPVETPGMAEGLAELTEARRTSGGRLRIAATIDPTQPRRHFERELAALREASEVSAIKLYPGYRPFYPHDRRLDPVYELALERGIAILLHQGDTLHPSARLRFARPIEVDDVAVRFPKLPLVLCHFGNPWIEEAAEVVYKNPNVYADTSGLLSHPGRHYFPEMLRRIQGRLDHAIASIGEVDRVLFGSDWPLQSIATSMEVVAGLSLHDGDRPRILGANARRLFRIPPPRSDG